MSSYNVCQLGLFLCLAVFSYQQTTPSPLSSSFRFTNTNSFGQHPSFSVTREQSTGSKSSGNGHPIQQPLAFPIRQSHPVDQPLSFPLGGQTSSGPQSTRHSTLTRQQQSSGNQFTLRDNSGRSFRIEKPVPSQFVNPSWSVNRNSFRPDSNSFQQNLNNRRFRQASGINNSAAKSQRRGTLSFPLPSQQNTVTQTPHPDANSRFYQLMVLLERPTAGADTSFTILQAIYTIYRSMSINDLVPVAVFKIVGTPCVVIIVKGRKGSPDIASSIERVARSIERLGTKVTTTLLYSLEAFVETHATKLLPSENVMQSTRAPIRDLGNKNLFLCHITFKGGDMDKLTYMSEVLNTTLDMLEKRAQGQIQFQGHRVSGTLPFEFQFYIHEEPSSTELAAINALPRFHAGNVVLKLDEIQPLDHVINTIRNTEAVSITQI